jgi:hypothetical protein
MKLIRFGDPNKEKPGIILEDGIKCDVSSFGEDYDERFFESDGVSRLEKWLHAHADGIPNVDDTTRLGPPVCRPGKLPASVLTTRTMPMRQESRFPLNRSSF